MYTFGTSVGIVNCVNTVLTSDSLAAVYVDVTIRSYLLSVRGISVWLEIFYKLSGSYDFIVAKKLCLYF